MRRRVAIPYVVVGAICGLTWAAACLGWSGQVALGFTSSELSWTTLGVALVSGLVTGGLLGWSAYLRTTALPASRWLALTPALLALRLLDPEGLDGPGAGRAAGGVLVGVTTALCLGYAGPRTRWSARRVACAVVAVAGLVLTWTVAGPVAPASTAHGAWMGLYGVVLVLLLGLAAMLPYRPVHRPLGAGAWTGLGALVGLAWSCALREFMAEVAGADSGVEWGLTFGFILLPGLLIGALLGLAEHLRRTGRHPGWPFVVAPFLFAAVLFSDPLHLGELFHEGIGGGTVGVPAIAMCGGYAVFGRGRAWPRVICGLLFLAGFSVWLLVASDVGGESFSLTTGHGIWVSALYESLLVVFALGAGVPHRRPIARDVTAARPAPLTTVA